MSPEEAGTALAPLTFVCNDWTDAKFAMWCHMIADEAADPAIATQASIQLAKTITTTFTPPFSAWLDTYRALRRRALAPTTAPALPATTGTQPSVHAAIAAAKAVLGNGRHTEHTPGHVGCQRCDDIAKAFQAQMPATVGRERWYRCARCLDTGWVELDDTGHGTWAMCSHDTRRNPEWSHQ